MSNDSHGDGGTLGIGDIPETGDHYRFEGAIGCGGHKVEDNLAADPDLPENGRVSHGLHRDVIVALRQSAEVVKALFVSNGAGLELRNVDHGAFYRHMGRGIGYVAAQGLGAGADKRK